jgi:Zn-dependent M28 family amino/carboxypeptidase
MSRTKYAIAFALALVMALGAVGVASAAVPTDSEALRTAVTAEGIMVHENAFQAIADENGDTRASGTPGYDASADYVADKLNAAGYQVTRQEFAFDAFSEPEDPVFERVSPGPKVYANPGDFVTMEFSGSGEVSAPLQATNDIVIPPGATASTSDSGCEPEDFDGFTQGNVALIQRGTCDFAVKAVNAEAAGASAAIIFNEGQEGRQETLNGTLGDARPSIPVIGTSFAVGEELYNLLQSGNVIVHVATTTKITPTTTENVIADTPTGRTDRTVVVGAHLDSVPEGPGINDNGSGSAANLEVALQMAELGIQPRNKVRFAFWGAEESGLIGSQFYVDELTKKQIQNIAVNLNFDMVGSPNYVRFVYDGDASDTASLGSTGSGVVEDVFVDYFDSQGLASEPTAFDGRSDYDAFINVGIPAGGLFTGAEGAKTAEQAATYGGLSTFEGKPVSYDPCYHQFCDSLAPQDFQRQSDPGYYQRLYTALDAAYDDQLDGNVNTLALDEMSDAIAHGTLTFAQSTSAVEGTDKGKAAGQSEALYQGSLLKR